MRKQMAKDTQKNYQNILEQLVRIREGSDFKSIQGIQAGTFTRACSMPYADDILQTFNNCVQCLELALKGR